MVGKPINLIVTSYVHSLCTARIVIPMVPESVVEMLAKNQL